VEFFQGITKLGEDLTAPYSFSWNNVQAGQYPITAVVTDNSGATVTSEIVNVNVNATISPLADAYVRDGSYAATNFGTANTLVVKYDGVNTSYNRETYLKFDLNGINNFDTATLRLSVAGAGNNVASNTFNVYYVPTDSWTETGINWSNKPASSTLLATINGQASGWVEWNISSQALAELAGDKTLSLRIVTTTLIASSDVTYRSKETTDPTLRPQLVLSQDSFTGKKISSFNTANLSIANAPLADESINVKIFPVPVKDILYIKINGYTGSSEAFLFNTTGQIILHKKLVSTDAELDVSGLSEGVYVVKIFSADGNILTTNKIIKRN